MWEQQAALGVVERATAGLASGRVVGGGSVSGMVVIGGVGRDRRWWMGGTILFFVDRIQVMV